MLIVKNYPEDIKELLEKDLEIAKKKHIDNIEKETISFIKVRYSSKTGLAETWTIQKEIAERHKAGIATQNDIQFLNDIKTPDESLDVIVTKILYKSDLVKEKISRAIGIMRKHIKRIENLTEPTNTPNDALVINQEFTRELLS